MPGAGTRDVASPCGKGSAERAAGSRIASGERSSTPRRHHPRPATALADPCQRHGMPPAHECSGDRHYPCGFRFANEDKRRRENAGLGPFAAPIADKRCRSAPLTNAIGCQGPTFPSDSAAHPSRTRPCRDAGNRAMSDPGARYQGYQAAEGTPGGRKVPAASDMRGISASCVAIRAVRSRLLRFRITRDSCRYRAQSCQSVFPPGGSPHPQQGTASRLIRTTTR